MKLIGFAMFSTKFEIHPEHIPSFVYLLIYFASVVSIESTELVNLFTFVVVVDR